MRDTKVVYRYLLLAAALAILMSFRSAHAQTTQSLGRIVPVPRYDLGVRVVSSGHDHCKHDRSH